MPMASKRPKTIAEYIRAAPSEGRPHLRRLHAILKGVAPKHVSINQIFAGVTPFMFIVLISMALLYIFPGIGLWLPNYIYR